MLEGWNAHAEGGVEIYAINANHVGLFIKPHIEVLAQEMQAILDSRSRFY
jgi:thioesterase domain-containing protein